MGNLHSVTSNKVVAVYFPLNLFFCEGGGGDVLLLWGKDVLH